MKLCKKTVSVVVAMVMLAAMFVFIAPSVIMPKAYGDYDMSRFSKYYYINGASGRYISELGFYWSSQSNSDAENNLINNGYTPVGINFNAGASSAKSKYVHLGVKYTSNPTGTVTAFRVEVNGSHTDTIDSVINGKTVTFFKIGSGCNSVVPAVMDGAVDLNRGGGGDDLLLYCTTDPAAGLPVTDIGMSNSKSRETAYNELISNGYTLATYFDNTTVPADCNKGQDTFVSSSDYIFFGYKNTGTNTDVTTECKRLGETYKKAKDAYENGGVGYTSAAMRTALGNAEIVLADYFEDSYSTIYSAAAINSVNKALMEAMPAMSPGQAYSVNISAANYRRYFTFTPAETGDYVLFTTGEDAKPDTMLHILDVEPSYGADTGYNNNQAAGTYNIKYYNDDIVTIQANGNYVARVLGLHNYKSYIVARLSANTKYYIDCGHFAAGGTSYVQIRKAVDVTFKSAGGSGDKTLTLPAGYPTMKMNQAGVEREDHSLLAWSDQGMRDMPKKCMAADIISVPTMNATYYALWYPLMPEPVELNTGSDYVSKMTEGGQINYWQFTPQITGTYVLYSTSDSDAAASADPILLIYNAADYLADASYLHYNDDGLELRTPLGGNTASVGRNAVIKAVLNAGTKYLVGVKTCHDGSSYAGSGGCMGNISFRFESVPTVTFNADGGTAPSPDSKEVYIGRSYGTLPVTEKTGCTFDGWMGPANSTAYIINAPAEQSGSSNSGSFTDIKKWKLDPSFKPGESYTLEFDAKGTGDIEAYFYGEQGYLQVANAVSGGGETRNSADGYFPFALNSSYTHYTVTYTLGSVGDGAVARYVLLRVRNGSSATVRNVKVLQNKFVSDSTVRIPFDHTLTAKWTVNTYTVTWIADGQKTTVPVRFGETITNPAAPVKEGYTFKGWTPEVPRTMPANDLTFTAVFEKNAVPSVGIAGYTANLTVNFKTTMIFHCEASDLPKGAQTHWFINGKDMGTGETYTVSKAKSSFSVQIKAIDEDGNVVAESAVEQVKVKTDIFSVIIAFIKNLFGAEEIIDQR